MPSFIFCTNCGTKVPLDMKFCFMCGVPIEIPDDYEIEAVIPETAAAAQNVSPVPATAPVFNEPASSPISPEDISAIVQSVSIEAAKNDVAPETAAEPAPDQNALVQSEDTVQSDTSSKIDEAVKETAETKSPESEEPVDTADSSEDALPENTLKEAEAPEISTVEQPEASKKTDSSSERSDITEEAAETAQDTQEVLTKVEPVQDSVLSSDENKTNELNSQPETSDSEPVSSQICKETEEQKTSETDGSDTEAETDPKAEITVADQDSDFDFDDAIDDLMDEINNAEEPKPITPSKAVFEEPAINFDKIFSAVEAGRKEEAAVLDEIDFDELSDSIEAESAPQPSAPRVRRRFDPNTGKPVN